MSDVTNELGRREIKREEGREGRERKKRERTGGMGQELTVFEGRCF